MNTQEDTGRNNQEGHRKAAPYVAQYSNGADLKDFLNSNAGKKHEKHEHRLSTAVFELEDKFDDLKRRLSDVAKTSTVAWKNFK